MRPDFSYNSSQLMRNSYGFEPVLINRAFQPRNIVQSKPMERAFQEPQRNIGNLIKNLQSKIEGVEQLAHKKKNQSNTISEQSLLQIKQNSNDRQPQQKTQFAGLPSEFKGMNLRGSCPNTYKRQNLRNTVTVSQHAPIIERIRNQFSPRRNQAPAQQNHNFHFTKSHLQTTSLKEIERKVNKSPPTHVDKNGYSSTTTDSSIPNNKAKSSNNIASEKVVFNSLNEIMAKKELIKSRMTQTAKRNNNLVGGYEIGKNLGKGKFGQVFLAKHVETGFVVALKKIIKDKVKQYKMIEQLKNEIRLHSSLVHPNIVRFFGMFENGDDIYLVMEYMNGGTLFDYLNQKDTLPLKQAVDFLRDTITALQYLHQRSIAHRDIKPQNIVMSSEGVAKLCDFGWSAVVQNSRKTYCGTFDYAPPEILQRKNYDTSVDIWCMGVLTYELLTGKVPFEGQKRNVVMNKIINVDKNKMEFPQQLDPDARNFIQSLVRKDPQERPKCKDLLKHPLFVNNPPATQSKGKKSPV